MGDDVLGRHPVDVVASDRLQLEHHRREPVGRHPLAADPPRDVVVLAENAAQVAAGEEDRPRAATPSQAVLLPEVRKVGGDYGVASDRAEALYVVAAVDLAEPGADRAAGAEQLVGLPRAPLELGAVDHAAIMPAMAREARDGSR